MKKRMFHRCNGVCGFSRACIETHFLCIVGLSYDVDELSVVILEARSAML